MLVKIFERKWVIQFFGIALILAPFFNLSNSVLEVPNIEKKYLIFYCWQFYKSAPFTQQAIQFASLVIGFVMLRGSVAAWKYALGLLGCYIVVQFTQLNANMRDNWNWIYLGINVCVFFFIADQIVLKPRPPQAAKPKAPPVAPPAAEPVASSDILTSVPTHAPVPTSAESKPMKLVEVATETGSFTTFEEYTSVDAPVAPAPAVAPVVDSAPARNVTPIKPAYRSRKKIFVNFDGVGKWATVSDISDAGLKVRAIAPAPNDISSRTLELTLGTVNLRLKFHQQDGADFSFNFIDLSASEKKSLNQWLLSIAS